MVESTFRCIEVEFSFEDSKVELRDQVGSGPSSIKKISMADPECEDKVVRFLHMAEPYGRGY
jgi:hypothetical protein